MKRLISIILISLILTALPITALADDGITLSLSQTTANVGDEIIISGTAPADTWISLEGTDADGNILYFSADVSDTSGTYGHTFKIPDMADGTLTITAGNGSLKTSATITVYTKHSGGGSSGGDSEKGSVTSATSSVSAYDTEDGKTAAVTITSSTDAGNSITTANVTSENIASLLSNIEKDAAGLSGISVIEINVLSTETVKTVEVNIPLASFQKLTSGTDAEIKICTSLGTICLNAKAAEDIGISIIGKTLCVSIKQKDAGALSNDAKTAVSGMPVYELSFTSGSTAISNFSGGKARVSIPYTITDGKDSNEIVVYYINASGKAVIVPNCVYDAKTKTVVFTTTHFSTYGLGYHAVSFSDVPDSAWYSGYVSYLAARDITSGSGNGQYSSNVRITRAQFVTILARMSGDDLGSNTSSSFSDVAATDWYSPAAEWANANGIATGSGGKFDPNASITREQMAAMLYRYAEYAGSISNAEGMSAREFSDFSSISNWAQSSVQWAVSNEIVSGNTDGSFAPKSSATRAQAAKMIAVLLQNLTNDSME